MMILKRGKTYWQMNEEGLSSQSIIRNITTHNMSSKKLNIFYSVPGGLDLLAYHYITPGYPVDSYEKAKGMC